MPRIARLSSDVIDRIAAGEVVERPASVVKELLENALDAGARSVEVSLEGGGLERIVVSDDGEGMQAEDARLALERHATSKLRSADDLFAIETLGFRGEALSSIAAVSRMSLTTRQRTSEAAVRIDVEGGRLTAERTVGAPVGTTIVVDDLFFNTPARQKFMRAPATEQGHSVQAAMRVLLGTPKAGLVLTSSGRRLLDIPPDAPPPERVRAALGKSVDRVWSFVRATDGVEVSGFAASPEVSRRDTKGIWLFVNGRFVRDRTLQRSVMEAYQGVIERGRYPVVVALVSLDPHVVDVNVHPQKLEVRFSDSRAVYRAVGAALTELLAQAPWLTATERATASLRDEGRSVSRYPGRPRAPEPGVAEREPRLWASQPGRALRSGVRWGPWGAGRFTRLEIVDQTGGFIIGREPGGGGMLVIDRVEASARLARRVLCAEGGMRSASLLLPEVLELSTGHQRALVTHADAIHGAGFEIDPVGPDRYAVRAVPAALRNAPAHHLALAMLKAIGDGPDAWIDACLEVLVAGPSTPLDEAELGLFLSELETLDAEDQRAVVRRLDRETLGALFSS